jgi:uncharacterized protein (TIGR03083 family)
MNAHDVLKYGHLTLLGSLEGLPEAAWDSPGVCGSWSVKDVVAHLASYELVLVDILSGFTDGGPTPYLDRFKEPGGGFNDAEVEARRGQTVRETLEELNAAHGRTLDLVARIPAETTRQPGTLPWYGDPYALDDLIAYLYYGHKREHSAQIAVFRDRLPG